MAFVYHIELTNVCDLDCPYCPLTTSARGKAVMSEAVFRKVVEHMGRLSPLNFMILHHFGEPLLHPELERFVAMASRARLNPGFSTNGETLTQDRFEDLIEHGLAWMCVTFHTPHGEAVFHELRPAAMEHGIVYWGRRLTDEPVPHRPGAVFDYGIESQLRHTFAGSVGQETPRPPGGRPPCDYLDRQFVCVLHDGRVVPCAMDEKADHVLGTVDDLDAIVQAPSYELCRTCQGFTFYEGFRRWMHDVVTSGRFRIATDGWVAPLPLDAPTQRSAP